MPENERIIEEKYEGSLNSYGIPGSQRGFVSGGADYKNFDEILTKYKMGMPSELKNLEDNNEKGFIDENMFLKGDEDADEGLGARKEGFNEKFKDFYKENRPKKSNPNLRGKDAKAKLYQGRGRNKMDRKGRADSRYLSIWNFKKFY